MIDAKAEPAAAFLTRHVSIWFDLIDHPVATTMHIMHACMHSSRALAPGRAHVAAILNRGEIIEGARGLPVDWMF